MTTVTVATPPATPIEHKLLGETPAFWCQTFVLLAAAVFAYVQIKSSRAIERQRAAIDAIFAGRLNQELTDAMRQIAVLHAGDKNMASYGKEANKGCPELKIIRYALNHYEYVSVAIAEGIFDEAIFKNSMCRTLIKLYDRTKPFIDERRKYSDETVWQEFECLVVRWKAKPLRKKTIKAVQDSHAWWRFWSD